jgi:transposase
VCEFEVKTTSKDLAMLRSRREAGRQLYNSILGEGLRRLGRMREDTEFEIAKALPRGATGPNATSLQRAQAKARKNAFASLREKHGVREYDLHKHPSLAKDCWLRGHLDVNTQQKVATRAFKAVERWALGQSGKPRFKRYGELESLEGKSNTAGIRFRDGHIVWRGDFGTLDLPLIVRQEDEVQAHALQAAAEGRVKYVRLLSRTIRGRERAFCQLVLDGYPYQKAKNLIGAQAVGIDLGPSRVAVVAQGHVETIPFCPHLDRKEVARRRYIRRLDRQRRANNPENYQANGTVKPRAQRQPWESSVRQDQTRESLAETLRVMAAHRKSLQGQVANRILSLGNQIVAEKLNIRAWAKLWGRSISHKAPGVFQQALHRKAMASGGTFQTVATWSTYLSSRCLCGKRLKKALSERKHLCGCTHVPEGAWVDRDKFSAFLVLHCQAGKLDEEAARASWQAWGADCLLRSPFSNNQAAKGEALSSPRARGARQSSSTEDKAGQRRKAGRKARERRGISPPKPCEPRIEMVGTRVA